MWYGVLGKGEQELVCNCFTEKEVWTFEAQLKLSWWMKITWEGGLWFELDLESLARENDFDDRNNFFLLKNRRHVYICSNFLQLKS